MSIGEILSKINPVPQQKEMSKTEYKKLVDANVKLMDEIKILTKKYNIMKENAEFLAKIIDKAIEYITSEESIETFRTIESREEWLKINHILLEILKGENK